MNHTLLGEVMGLILNDAYYSEGLRVYPDGSKRDEKWHRK